MRAVRGYGWTGSSRRPHRPPWPCWAWTRPGWRRTTSTSTAARTAAGGPAGPVDLPGEPVEVFDTVGAGDAFMSGLLAALDRAGRLVRPGLPGLPHDEFTAALGYAQRIAALTCGRLGADPPWLAELA